MAKGSTLAKKKPARLLIVGYPKSGKTGAVACLLNRGFQVRLLDYDGNLEPLLAFVDEDKLDNLSAITLEDKMRLGSNGIEPVGIPSAFVNGFKAMDDWKEEDGTSLGSSSDWGLDTVVVLDSLTSMGDAAMNRAMKLLNKTPTNRTDGTWGLAMSEELNFIKRLCRADNPHHVIVLAHLKEVGPNDVRKGEDDITRELKSRLIDLIPTRLYASALGKQLPRAIGGEFPTILLAERRVRGGKVRRILTEMSGEEFDTAVPTRAELPAEMPIEDGLLTVFEALTPGIDYCLSHGSGVKSETSGGEA